MEGYITIIYWLVKGCAKKSKTVKFCYIVQAKNEHDLYHPPGPFSGLFDHPVFYPPGDKNHENERYPGDILIHVHGIHPGYISLASLWHFLKRSSRCCGKRSHPGFCR